MFAEMVVLLLSMYINPGCLGHISSAEKYVHAV